MSSKFKSTVRNTFLLYLPLLLLFISVFNEFDFNYLNYQYFSFNFPFILIFYWSLKRSESLGYGLIFSAGLFNDVVVGFPLGISSLSYLLICGFAAYFRNITLHPSLIKDWIFFLFTIMVSSSLLYTLAVVFFSYKLNYSDLLVNLLFTFLFYPIFARLFSIYIKLVFDRKTND